MAAVTDRVPAHVEYMHICDFAFPGQNNKPCIIGVFDFISSESFPMAWPLMAVAVQLRGQAGRIVPIRLVLEAQNGEKLAELPEVAMTIGPQGGVFYQANLMGVVFKESWALLGRAGFTRRSTRFADSERDPRRVKVQAA